MGQPPPPKVSPCPQGQPGPDGPIGPPGADGTLPWDSLTNVQKNDVVASLKAMYGDVLNVQLTDNDRSNIVNTLSNNSDFLQKTTNSLSADPATLVDIIKRISNDDNVKNALANKLSGSSGFLDNVANKITSDNNYSQRIKGDKGDALNPNDMKSLLNTKTLWCSDGNFCKIPARDVNNYKSYGINLMNADAIEKNDNGTDKYWGGKLSYITTGTAGNALLVQGVGTTQKSGEGNLDRKIYLWDNMETGVATVGNLLSVNGLMSVGGNDTVPFGGYLELGHMISTTGNVLNNVLNNKIFISNIPVKNADGTYDNSWVRLIKDKGDPNSFSKGLAASGFYAANDISAGGIVGTKNTAGDWTARMSDGLIKVGDSKDDQGKIGYGIFSDGVDIVGKGIYPSRKVKIWDVLQTGSVFASNINASTIKNSNISAGSVNVTGAVNVRDELKIGSWRIYPRDNNIYMKTNTGAEIKLNS